eukprot:GILI01012034.1.p1 GENE.GILI01012034.1~~GILI01012034.1.p1  ORF type:complete len:373 (-),score=64.86 GILI01012034.1:148-1152(-)
MFFEAALYQILASVVPGAGILPTSLVADFIRLSSLTDVFSRGGFWEPLNKLKAAKKTSSSDYHKVSDSFLNKLFSLRNKVGSKHGGGDKPTDDAPLEAALDDAAKEQPAAQDEQDRKRQLEELRQLVAEKASELPKVISKTELERVTSDRDYHLRVMRYVQARMMAMERESGEEEGAQKPDDPELEEPDDTVTSQRGRPAKNVNSGPASTDEKVFPRKIRDQIIMTGHSLGGAIGHIVGIRLKLRSVAFGSPGIVLSHKKFGINDLKSVHSRTFTVASSNDIVPLIGWQGGEVHHMECVAKTSEMCHVMEFMIGALWHNCRTIRDRYPNLIDVI